MADHAAARRRQERGSTRRCPKCGSTAVTNGPTLKVRGYGPGLAACRNCRAIWEPFDMAEIWDPDDPLCTFREPCSNCAFRPGSPEQAAPAKWRKLIADLRAGAAFHCHKGVPIEPDAEHGFAYPKDRRKLRTCRGYLDALGRWWDKERTENTELVPETAMPFQVFEPIAYDPATGIVRFTHSGASGWPVASIGCGWWPFATFLIGADAVTRPIMEAAAKAEPGQWLEGPSAADIEAALARTDGGRDGGHGGRRLPPVYIAGSDPHELGDETVCRLRMHETRRIVVVAWPSVPSGLIGRPDPRFRREP